MKSNRRSLLLRVFAAMTSVFTITRAKVPASPFETGDQAEASSDGTDGEVRVITYNYDFSDCGDQSLDRVEIRYDRFGRLISQTCCYRKG